MADKRKPIVCLLGPTASGKTELAVKLVEQLPLDIISVDSAMVYKGMDIGTAKPDPETLRRAPHRLIDFLDPAEAYSAARFCRDAQREIEAIHSAGRVPFLVGGTMMYFRSLLQGLAQLPAANESIRSELAAEAEQYGWQTLHRQLAEVDAQAAARIHPNDPQRISRALEVYRITGIPMSIWLQRGGGDLPYQVTLIGLVPAERAVLHERIAQRFARMLDIGLVDEVRGLYARGDLSPRLPAIRAVGYRQVWAYLEGELDYTGMRDKGIAATRQLAKRQLTWMRSMPGLINFNYLNKDLESAVLKIITKIHIN
jgi:tRNA dimethylallyltransferase